MQCVQTNGHGQSSWTGHWEPAWTYGGMRNGQGLSTLLYTKRAPNTLLKLHGLALFCGGSRGGFLTGSVTPEPDSQALTQQLFLAGLLSSLCSLGVDTRWVVAGQLLSPWESTKVRRHRAWIWVTYTRKVCKRVRGRTVREEMEDWVRTCERAWETRTEEDHERSRSQSLVLDDIFYFQISPVG